MDDCKGKIRLGEPQNGNEKFILEKLNPLYYAMRAANKINCFIAFDEDGELVDPCRFSITDPEVQIFFDVYDSD